MKLSTGQLLQTMENQMCSFPRESRCFLGHRPDSVWSQDLTKHFSASVKCFDISNHVKTLFICCFSKFMQQHQMSTSAESGYSLLRPSFLSEHWPSNIETCSLWDSIIWVVQPDPRSLLTDSVQSKAYFAAEITYLVVAFSWLALNPRQPQGRERGGKNSSLRGWVPKTWDSSHLTVQTNMKSNDFVGHLWSSGESCLPASSP